MSDKMSKRERLMAAFEQKPVDRVPVGFWFHFPEEKRDGQACIDAHMEYYRSNNPDFMKIMCDGYFTYPLDFPIEKPSDWRKLEPLTADHPFIREQVERAKAVVQGIGPDNCAFYNIFAPFSSIRFKAGDGLVMEHLQQDPESVLYALDVIAKSNGLLAQLCVTEAGCDGVYYCVQGGEKDRFTHEEYRKWITPSDKYVLEQVNQVSRTNILHCCGWAGIPNHLENWKDYPAKVVNWAVFIENLGLAEGKKFFEGKTVLGGFDNRKTGLLYHGSKEEIQKFARELLESSGTTGVMIGADCTLPSDIDLKHLLWVVEAAEKFGK